MENLFASIYKAASAMRKSNKNADGLAAWQRCKHVLEPFANIIAVSGFKEIPKLKVNLIMQLPEKLIDGYGNTKTIEVNHCLIQMVRIPTQESATLIKIMQIAFNYGQWDGLIVHIFKNGHRPSLIDGLTQLTDFIRLEDIAAMDSLLVVSLENVDIACVQIQSELAVLQVS